MEKWWMRRMEVCFRAPTTSMHALSWEVRRRKKAMIEGTFNSEHQGPNHQKKRGKKR